MPLLIVGLLALYPALLLCLFAVKWENTKPSRPSPPRPVEPSVAPEREQELLALVCPEVRAVLEAELRAGNRIVGGASGGDWPWPDSTLISLGFIFRAEPAPLPPALRFDTYDFKVGMGDSVDCEAHRILVIAAMPTLEEHLSETVLVGGKRRARLKS